MRIKAFKAVRPPVEWAAKVASLPYDVGSLDVARAEAKGNPASFLHVERAEVDFSDDQTLTPEVVHSKARDNFARFLKKGYLTQDAAERLCVYRQTWQGRSQVGIVAVCRAEDYDKGVILRHEKTKKPTDDERTRHISLVNANTGPVFLIYRDKPELLAFLDEVQKNKPIYDFTAPDGVGHTVWEVPDAERLVKLFESVPQTYIADGHHRAAAAARVAKERNGSGESAWFLTVLFPASHLTVLPYNRCVKDLNGMTAASFLQRAGQIFKISPGAGHAPKQSGHISMYLNGQWFDLTWTPNGALDPVSVLDVSVLQDRLLGPVLGIQDPRHNTRIDYLGGVKSVEQMVELVDSGKGAVGFSMYPTSVEQLMKISDANQIMPPKSTWFEPKLRSGLFVHPLS